MAADPPEEMDTAQAHFSCHSKSGQASDFSTTTVSNSHSCSHDFPVLLPPVVHAESDDSPDAGPVAEFTPLLAPSLANEGQRTPAIKRNRCRWNRFRFPCWCT